MADNVHWIDQLGPNKITYIIMVKREYAGWGQWARIENRDEAYRTAEGLMGVTGLELIRVLTITNMEVPTCGR